MTPPRVRSRLRPAVAGLLGLVVYGVPAPTAPDGAQPQRRAQLSYCTTRLMERRSPYGCRRTCECHPA